MRKICVLVFSAAVIIGLSALQLDDSTSSIDWDGSMAVDDVLRKLGEGHSPFKAQENLSGVSIERGKALVYEGYYHEKGKFSKLQSKHFACIACHNTVKEDPDLSISNPETRLDYAIKNNLPFLQGTTLYGAVNRSHFYNGDYFKKYGDLVIPTKNNLREAIQLCAIECSQGRRLKPAELESVLAYMWTLELKLDDLNFNDAEKDAIVRSIKNGEDTETAIEAIKGKYLDGSPATFVDAPEDRKKGYGPVGNPDNGKWIYELSCLHCHAEKKFSFFELDKSTSSFEFLRRHFSKYNKYSVYQVARYGTSPLNWKHAYMPQYTKQKMSDGQMEDLRAYVELMCDKNKGL